MTRHRPSSNDGKPSASIERLRIAGPGEYRAPFVEMLIERLGDYARFEFDSTEPGFEALRYFGDRVMRTMGISRTNRRMMDHVMKISAPRDAR